MGGFSFNCNIEEMSVASLGQEVKTTIIELKGTPSLDVPAFSFLYLLRA